MTLTEKARTGFSSITLRGGRITKWKGQTASYSPHLGHLAVGVSGVAMAAALAFSPDAALAGECVETSPGSNEWVCAGPALAGGVTDTPQTITSTGALTISTEPGFGLNTASLTGLAGISATSNGPLTFTDNNGSTIFADRPALRLTNNGPGAINLFSNGVIQNVQSVTTLENSAVAVIGGAATTGITIVTNQTLAPNDSIGALNNGIGALSITSTGYARSNTQAIRAINGATATDLTITANELRALLNGVLARQYGTGALTITVNGPIFAGATGVVGFNSDNGTNLTVTTKDTVYGFVYGISASNGDGGALEITTTGTVTGKAATGIRAVNAGTDLVIEAVDTTGGARGIYGNNTGSGQLSITATGTTTATSGTGIIAANDGTDLTINANIVSGTADGIRAINRGTGSTEITTTGTVTGTAGTGISATTYNGTDLIIDAQDDVTGGTYGIFARNNSSGALTITSSGTTTGTGNAGIVAVNSALGTDLTITAVDTDGGNFGISASNQGSGSLSITSTGTANGGAIGISATNAGTDLSVNANIATGGTNGISAGNFGSGALSVVATGTVTGTNYYGIYARNEGTRLTVSAVDVSGGAAGIFARNRGTGALSVTATGTVNGTTGTGITAINLGTDLTIDAATVTGGYGGIIARNYGSGALAVTATGPVTGNTQDGIFAENTGTSLTINAVDSTGQSTGINAVNSGTGALTINSTGTATGTAFDGIFAENSGTNLTINANDASGRVGVNALNYGTGAVSVTVTGTATGTDGDGIYAYNSDYGTDLTINANNAAGSEYGVFATQYGTGALAVTVTGTATGTNGAGIDAYNSANGTSLTINANNVTGGTNGIYAIQNGSGALSITATGTVTGTSTYGVYARNSAQASSDPAVSNDTTINVNNTSGGYGAIRAIHEGAGKLSITSTGAATTGNSFNSTAIYARAVNGAEGLTINAKDVSSRNVAILARLEGTGDLSIRTTGTVSSVIGSGISATTNGTTRNMSIDAVDVTGDNRGISASHSGTGTLSITATGTITGLSAGSTGISARVSSASTGITIEANNVTGGSFGINALNSGTGDLTITTTGTVSATDDPASYGIYAYGEAGSGKVTVDAATTSGETFGITAGTRSSAGLFITSGDATGGATGIIADNFGRGALSVTSTGLASGDLRYGISAQNFGTDATIDAVDTEGGQAGIRLRNLGNGSASITSTGTATGTARTGIEVVTSYFTQATTISANNSSGGQFGIYANHGGGGLLSITSNGTATGTSSTGILAINVRGTGTTIQANNSTGGDYGIQAQNSSGALSITSTGLAQATNGLDPYNIDGPAGILAINGAGATNLTIASNDAIGALFGIRAVNEGTGSLVITSTGTASGDTGISAILQDAGTDLSITANNTTAYGRGISAANYGSGSLTIVSTGTATGGISAINDADATDITITANNSTGFASALQGVLLGTGKLTITSTGTASATFTGISALAYGSGLEINAKDTSGAFNGIRADNEGSGALAITSTGTASSVTGYGIFAENAAGATDLTIVSNIASGQQAAIRAISYGTGAVTITSTRAVSSYGNAIVAENSGNGTGLTINSDTAIGDGFAINANNGGSGDLVINSGTATGNVGIGAFNFGTGAVTITTTGTTSGANGNGIQAINRGTDLTIDAADTSGGNNGIYAANTGTGALSITTSGLVSGTNGRGISAVGNGTDLTVNADDTSGATFGIYARNRGTGVLSVTSSGSATGTGPASYGLFAGNSAAGNGVTVDANDTSGSNSAIFARNYGSGSISVTSRGTASSTSNAAIVAVNNASGTNLVVSSANASGNDGIFARNFGSGTTTVTSTGTATGSGAYGRGMFVGVDGATAGDVTVIAGTSYGPLVGIAAVNNGAGSLSITATGTSSASTGSGIAMLNGASANNLTLSAATVTGGTEGILAAQGGRGSANITTTGVVTGTTGEGIDLSTAATSTSATVTTRSDVTGVTSGILVVHRGTGALTIASQGRTTASGAGSSGIDASILGTFTGLNAITANLTSGVAAGIRATNNGAGALSITTTGATTATAGSGIIASNAGTSLTIVANALVSGSVDGIRATNTGTGGLFITGNGNVTGTTGAAVRASNSANDTTASMVITQAAGTTWTGGSDGITAVNAGGSLTVNAAGTVIGQAGAGTLAQNAATATLLTVNAFNATGTTSGIDTRSLGTQGAVINLTGIAQGGTGAGIDTQTNAGIGASHLTTINLNQGASVRAGSSGIAIRNNVGNAVVNMNAGSTITGTVRLGDGSDTFNVNNAALSLAGIILDGGDDVAGGDGWVDTLNLNNAWSGTLRGADLLGWENINLNGGTLRFSDSALTVGALLLNGAARLDGSNNLVVTGAVGIAGPAAFIAGSSAGTNAARITGDVTNFGTIDLRGPTGTSATGDRLTIGGNLSGNGTIRLDTALGGSNATDLLVVNGNLTGQNVLVIANAGGTGALTTGDGIRLVDVGGTSAPGALTLAGNAIDVGGFRYALANTGADWFLRSRARDIVVSAMSIANITQTAGLASLGTLNERIGEQTLLTQDGGESGFMKGAWTRAFGSGFTDKATSATLGDSSSDGQYGGLQLGIDLYRSIAADGSRFQIGVLGGWLWTGSGEDMTRPIRMESGSTNGDGWVAGAYLTYLSAADWYVDIAAQRQSIDQRAAAVDGTTLETKAESWYASIELGKAFGTKWKIEPQVQLVYGSTDIDSVTDSAGIANRLTVEDTLTGRAGLRLKRAWDNDAGSTGGRFAVYAKANVWRHLSGGESELAVGGSAPGTVAFGETWGDVGLGTTFSLGKNTTFFADAEVEYGIDQGSTALSGRTGLNIRF